MLLGTISIHWVLKEVRSASNSFQRVQILLCPGFSHLFTFTACKAESSTTPVVHKAAAPHTPHTSMGTACAWNYTLNFSMEFIPQGACKKMIDVVRAGWESLLLVLQHPATGQGVFSSCIPSRIITTWDCFSPLFRYFWCNFSFFICIHFDSAGVGALFGADDKELCSSHHTVNGH